jgi:hypothetical protein
VFGGRGDPNNSAYDNHFITDEEFGVALPDRIAIKPRPRCCGIDMIGRRTDGAGIDLTPAVAEPSALMAKARWKEFETGVINGPVVSESTAVPPRPAPA